MRLKVVLLASLLCLPGCSLFQPAAPQGLLVTMDRSDLTAESFGALVLTTVFVIENPNAFDVTIDEVEKTLRVESRPLRNTAIDARQVVPADSRIEMPARMTLRGRELAAAVDRTPEDGRIAAAFQLAVRSNQRELDPDEWFTAEWHGKLPIMLAPDLTFVGIERESLSALQADIHFLLELQNPNPYPVHLRSLAFDLKINGTPFGAIASDQIDSWIPGNERIRVKVSQSYRLSNEGSEIFKVLAHSERFQVEVKGQAEFAFDSPLSPLKAQLSASGTARP